MTEDTQETGAEMMLPGDSFGERLKACRIKASLSISSIAEALEVSNQAVYNYEKVPKAIAADTLFKLADLLGVNARWLLRGVADDDSPPAISPEGDPSAKQALACLKAYVDTGCLSKDLVHAAISLLESRRL